MPRVSNAGGVSGASSNDANGAVRGSGRVRKLSSKFLESDDAAALAPNLLSSSYVHQDSDKEPEHLMPLMDDEEEDDLEDFDDDDDDGGSEEQEHGGASSSSPSRGRQAGRSGVLTRGAAASGADDDDMGGQDDMMDVDGDDEGDGSAGERESSSHRAGARKGAGAASGTGGNEAGGKRRGWRRNKFQPMPKDWHGYACSNCGTGVGWNAKVCKACKTKVDKPPAKYKEHEYKRRRANSTSKRTRDSDGGASTSEGEGGQGPTAGMRQGRGDGQAARGRKPRKLSVTESEAGAGGASTGTGRGRPTRSQGHASSHGRVSSRGHADDRDDDDDDDDEDDDVDEEAEGRDDRDLDEAGQDEDRDESPDGGCGPAKKGNSRRGRAASSASSADSAFAAGSGAGASARGGPATKGKGNASSKRGRAPPADDEAEDGYADASDADGVGQEDLDHLLESGEVGAVRVVKGAGVATVKVEKSDGTFVHSVSRPKAAPPQPVYAPLSPLDSVNLKTLTSHIQALQAETFQRRYRPLLIKLMESAKNGGVFNTPVNPVELGIPDYFDVIKFPMDLGTVRQKLEAGLYHKPDELANDVILTFDNAQRYNPPANPVHQSAKRLQEEFVVEFNRLLVKGEADVARKDAHSCAFCQGQMCLLCNDKCMRFDPPVMSCDCCMERIKRGDTYYRAPSGQRWCARCVSNGGANAEPGAILPPLAILKSATQHTLEMLVRAMGVTEAVTYASHALGAATNMAGRFGGGAALAAAAAMQAQQAVLAQAAAQAAAEHQLKYGMKLRSRSAAAAAAASHGNDTGASSSISGPNSSAPSSPTRASAAPSAAASPDPQHGSTGAAAMTSGPGGSSGPSLPAPYSASSLANLAGLKGAQAIKVMPSLALASTTAACTGAAAAAAPPSALTISTGAVSGSGSGSNSGVPTPTETGGASGALVPSSSSAIVITPLATSGPNAHQLLAAMKAAGVDTHALTIAVQKAADAAATADVGAQRTVIGTLASILRGRLEKRRNDDVVAEPWVQCDRCKGWVHQVCAMFNARKNACLPFNAEYTCPQCRRMDLIAQAKQEAEAAWGHSYSTRHKDKATSAMSTPRGSPAITTGPTTTTAGARSPSAGSPTGAQSVAAARSTAMVDVRANATLFQQLQQHNNTIAAGVLRSRAGSAGASATAVNNQAVKALMEAQRATAQSAVAAAAASSSSASDVYTADKLGVSNADVGFGVEAQHKDGHKDGKHSETGNATRAAGAKASSGAAAAGASSNSEAASESEAETPSAVLSASADPACAASALPHTPLSEELERRVRERVRAETSADVANSIVVRVVSSLKKNIAVPREVREVFKLNPTDPATMISTIASSECTASTAVESVVRDGVGLAGATKGSTPKYKDWVVREYAPEYTYRQRVILLWQRLDGVDVCLFALYVQEYGQDCPPPNTRKVYIAYLDSVRYLRPLTARTACYHELLAAYLGNARQRGYLSTYIWACPPQRGDGYIFHCHPPSQRVPGKDRLREWYDDMLRPLSEEGIVEGINSLFDEYFEILQVSPALPLPAACTLVREASQSAVTAAVSVAAAVAAAGQGSAGTVGSAAHPGASSAIAPVDGSSVAKALLLALGDAVGSSAADVIMPHEAQSSAAGGAAEVVRQQTGFTVGFAPASSSFAPGAAGLVLTAQPHPAGMTAAGQRLSSGVGLRATGTPVPMPAFVGATTTEAAANAAAISAAAHSAISAARAGMRRRYRPNPSSRYGYGKGKPRPPPSPMMHEVIALRGDSGLPPYFAGDFWATEMERTVRELHKKLVNRALRGTEAGAEAASKSKSGAGAGASSKVPGPVKSAAPGQTDDALNVRVLDDNVHARSAVALAPAVQAGLGLAAIDPALGTSTRAAAQRHAMEAAKVAAQAAKDAAKAKRAAKRTADQAEADGPASAGTSPNRPSKKAKTATGAAAVIELDSDVELDGITARQAAKMGSSPVNSGAGAAGAGASAAGHSSSSATRTHNSVAEFINANPMNVTGNVIRLGDLALPTFPVTNLGSRLREMQREIFVVHLTPNKPKRVAAAQAAALAAANAAKAAAARAAGGKPGEDGAEGDGDVATEGGYPYVGSDGEIEQDTDADDATTTIGGREGGSTAPRLRFAETPATVKASKRGAARDAASTTGAADDNVSLAASGAGASMASRPGLGRRAASFHSAGAASTAPTASEDGTSYVSGSSGMFGTGEAAAATAESDAQEDERITCDFFDTRSGFLRMCQGNNYQFDTLRRAKHSSMMILWHLHNPSIPAYQRTCNVCESDIGVATRWHCEECFDYDVCEDCKDTCGHPHELVAKRDNNIVVKLSNGVVAAGGQIISANQLDTNALIRDRGAAESAVAAAHASGSVESSDGSTGAGAGASTGPGTRMRTRANAGQT